MSWESLLANGMTWQMFWTSLGWQDSIGMKLGRYDMNTDKHCLKSETSLSLYIIYGQGPRVNRWLVKKQQSPFRMPRDKWSLRAKWSQHEPLGLRETTLSWVSGLELLEKHIVLQRVSSTYSLVTLVHVPAPNCFLITTWSYLISILPGKVHDFQQVYGS